jgi:hypothetical protein
MIVAAGLVLTAAAALTMRDQRAMSPLVTSPGCEQALRDVSASWAAHNAITADEREIVTVCARALVEADAAVQEALRGRDPKYSHWQILIVPNSVPGHRYVALSYSLDAGTRSATFGVDLSVPALCRECSTHIGYIREAATLRGSP